MPKKGELSWKWLMLPALLALLAVLIWDLGGWGAFLLDILQSVLIQAAVAVALYWAAAAVLRRLTTARPARDVEAIIFALAAIVALPFLRLVFHRSLDLYDAAQTAILLLAFLLLREPLRRFRRSPRLSVPSRLDPAQSQSPQSDRRYSFSPHYAPHTASREYRELYARLVARAGGDRSLAERLIARQRQRTPGASPEDQLRDILDEWDRDNR